MCLAVPVLLQAACLYQVLNRSVARLLGSDKKRRAGGQVWIVPRALGDAATTTAIPDAVITEAIYRLAEGRIPHGT